jgi:hypothetical protein
MPISQQDINLFIQSLNEQLFNFRSSYRQRVPTIYTAVGSIIPFSIKKFVQTGLLNLNRTLIFTKTNNS